MNTEKQVVHSFNRMFSKNDQETMRFFQLPKNLYENNMYKEVSNGAKVMYAILRDRQDLSINNEWIDENGFIFFYYDGDKLAEYLNVSRPTIQKYKKELIKCNLMIQKRQGQGKPNRMYILKPESVDITLMKNKFTSRSKENEHLELKKLITNDTESKETNIKDTEYIHHSDEVTCALLNTLNAFSIEKFNKTIRQHDPNKHYVWDVLDGYDEELTLELESNITKYEQCNLDYLETIQARFK